MFTPRVTGIMNALTFIMNEMTKKAFLGSSLWRNVSSLQFKMVALRSEEPIFAFPVPQKFCQRCIWNSSSVRLINDGPFSSFQGRSSSDSFCLSSKSSSASSLYASLFQFETWKIMKTYFQFWRVWKCITFSPWWLILWRLTYILFTLFLFLDWIVVKKQTTKVPF